MRNKLAILTLLILFIVSISCVSAEDSNSVSVLSGSNSDVYVSPTGNDNNVGDVNNPFATINKAIDSNVSNIHLSEGKFIGTGNNGLTIENKSITIIGAGADKTIIDLNKTQFMDIKSTSSVVLTNLTIINGYTKYGGAIYNNGNLTIQNCNFISVTCCTKSFQIRFDINICVFILIFGFFYVGIINYLVQYSNCRI